MKVGYGRPSSVSPTRSPETLRPASLEYTAVDSKDLVSSIVEGEDQHPRLFSDHTCTMIHAHEYTYTHT